LTSDRTAAFGIFDGALRAGIPRYRTLNACLADGFAPATAVASDAHLATFDRRVHRALTRAGIPLAAGFS